LKLLAELLDAGNRNFIEVHKKKGSRSPRPIKLERPWERRRRRQATPEELRAWFGGAIHVSNPPEGPESDGEQSGPLLGPDGCPLPSAAESDAAAAESGITNSDR
jgi:hypothetical protein